MLYHHGPRSAALMRESTWNFRSRNMTFITCSFTCTSRSFTTCYGVVARFYLGSCNQSIVFSTILGKVLKGGDTEVYFILLLLFGMFVSELSLV